MSKITICFVRTACGSGRLKSASKNFAGNIIDRIKPPATAGGSDLSYRKIGFQTAYGILPDPKFEIAGLDNKLLVCVVKAEMFGF